MHNAESESSRNCAGVWLLLKEQSGKNLLMDEHLHHIKEGGGGGSPSLKFDSAVSFITRSQNFVLCDRISRQNRT